MNPTKMTLTGSIPRVCGGTVRNAAGNTVSAGLSPRVRGNQFALFLCPFLLRSNPRVCGGTSTPAAFSNLIMGLSPRVRGTSSIASPSASASGLSPRVRGNPVRCGVIVRSHKVYPRVCGGTGIRG